MEKDWLGRADPNRGRFRAFVQVLLKRFARDRLEHEHAAKRHPGKGTSISNLDGSAAEHVAASAATDDDAAFDRDWAQVAIGRAIAEVEAASEREGVVLRDLLRTDGRGSRDLAEILGVHARQLPVIKTRVRHSFAKHFAAQLAATVRDPADFEEEWRALSAYLP